MDQIRFEWVGTGWNRSDLVAMGRGGSENKAEHSPEWVRKCVGMGRNRLEWEGIGTEWIDTEQIETDLIGTDWNRANQVGTEWNGTEQDGGEWNGREQNGSGGIGSERIGTERIGTDWNELQRINSHIIFDQRGVQQLIDMNWLGWDQVKTSLFYFCIREQVVEFIITIIIIL